MIGFDFEPLYQLSHNHFPNHWNLWPMKMATVLSIFWRKDWKVPLAKNFETSWQKCVAFSSGHTGAFTLRASLKITVQRNKKLWSTIKIKFLKHLRDIGRRSFSYFKILCCNVFPALPLASFVRGDSSHRRYKAQPSSQSHINKARTGPRSVAQKCSLDMHLRSK